MRVGFVGLGAMGRPMAMHLLRAGHRLAVWARRPEAAAPLLAAGAIACADAADVARRSEVVFTIVTGSADVESVALGADGLGEGLAVGSILVDMSTIAPETARSLARRLSRQGVDMLDAPVSGGEQGAIAATLAIMVGGKAAVLERVRPLARMPRQDDRACRRQRRRAGGQGVQPDGHGRCDPGGRRGAAPGRAAGADPARVRQALGGGSAAAGCSK
jgi:2-hydroxy-3-oxopropionate reductase